MLVQKRVPVLMQMALNSLRNNDLFDPISRMEAVNWGLTLVVLSTLLLSTVGVLLLMETYRAITYDAAKAFFILETIVLVAAGFAYQQYLVRANLL